MKLPNNPKVLAATYNPVSNTKMISFLVDFPTVLLAELRTHRILTQGSLYEHSELTDISMSANSARAIPHNKYLEKVKNNPFAPIWTKQQKGMSGDKADEEMQIAANYLWMYSLWSSKQFTDEDSIQYYYNKLIGLGIHKQNANRLLAPFAWTTCILSGTEWQGFFSLRCPHYTSPNNDVYYSKREYIKNIPYCNNGEYLKEEFWQSINKSTAQPEFQVIAEMLYDLYQEADWEESKYHIPFKKDILKLYSKELNNISSELFIEDQFNASSEYYNILMKISASMCAKLSYNTQDNEDTLEKHLERADMLIEHKHQEPFSHQAVAMNYDEYEHMFIQSIVKINNKREIKRTMGVAYNLRGFISQRYILENY